MCLKIKMKMVIFFFEVDEKLGGDEMGLVIGNSLPVRIVQD